MGLQPDWQQIRNYLWSMVVRERKQIICKNDSNIQNLQSQHTILDIATVQSICDLMNGLHTGKYGKKSSCALEQMDKNCLIMNSINID